MKWTYAALIAAALSVPVAAQAPATTNPFQGNAERIRAGMAGFNIRCADCHGTDAKGVRAPDITQVWASGRTDEGLFNTIRNGVPNTEMPSFPPPRTQDYEIWQVLAYLRTLAAPAPTDPPRGDAANGEKVFRANCVGCHRVNGSGGRLGPDLSRVGVSRTREALTTRIRRSAEGDHRAGYAPVTIQPPSGPAIQGVKKNEDTFSVQIMDTRERIQGFEKDKMKSVQDNIRSAMPAFGPERISDRDLDDLLRYLSTLRGFDPAVAQ
ncbi:MAG: c-type cytochrome [Acidimicrobiia bacterium]|nr:c-type cytochrome [Acidimicrobiia bacterium]